MEIGAQEQRPWTPPDVLRDLEAAGCADAVLELIEDFRTDTAQRLQRLRLTMAGADPVAFRREAHSIKGSAMQMGAAEVSATAKSLELEGSTMPAWAIQAAIEKLQTQFDAVCQQMAAYTLRVGK